MRRSTTTLGLSHLRAGDLGRALWSLRLAQQMEPRDESIQVTLAEVRAQIAETASANDGTLGAIMQATGDSVVYQVAGLTTNLFTLNELALMALSFWTLFALLLMVWVLRVQNQFLRRLARIATPIVGMALVITGLTLGSRMYQYHSLTEAVVVAQSVELNSGPGAEYAARLVLPSGAEVNVLEERAAGSMSCWTAMARPDGRLRTRWPHCACEAEFAILRLMRHQRVARLLYNRPCVW